MAETLLKVAGLQSWYGESHILHGVDFEIGRGELVTLLGRNGAGKTSSTLKSVHRDRGAGARGSIKSWKARRRWANRPHKIARRGIALLPRRARHLRRR
jgi:branched-chain amino acid transport system ATP-binding protein